MIPYSVDEFKGKIDSLYRLVIIAARRANQISKNESHGFSGTSHVKKPTMTALREILENKVGFYTSDEEDEHFLE